MLHNSGMKLGVHNHTPEMVNKAREFHANFQKTEKTAVVHAGLEALIALARRMCAKELI